MPAHIRQLVKGGEYTSLFTYLFIEGCFLKDCCFLHINEIKNRKID